MFKLPDVIEEPHFWGPPSADEEMYHIPQSLFSKVERISYINDFMNKDSADSYSPAGGAGSLRGPFNIQVKGTGAFNTVKNNDQEKFVKRSKELRKDKVVLKNPTQTQPWRGGRGGSAPQRGGGGRGGRGSRGGRGGRGRAYVPRENIFKPASIHISDEFTILHRFDLSELQKSKPFEPPKPQDVTVRGSSKAWNQELERCSVRQSFALPFNPQDYRERYTTTKDPVIREIARTYPGTKKVVFVTDEILVTLMTAARSVFAWDVQFQKFKRFVFIDKREVNKKNDRSCNIGAEWVNETHQNQNDVPNDNKPTSINCATNLMRESTQCCRAFAQACLAKQKLLFPGASKSPFAEEDKAAGRTPSATIYRYRAFTLHAGTDDEYDIVVRCELDAAVPAGKGGTEASEWMRVFALLESQSDPAAAESKSPPSEWLQQLSDSRGNIIATNIKNNACKFARWAALSILAGANTMKFALVVRPDSNSADRHLVVGVETKSPLDLASQIGLKVQNMWSSFDTIYNIFCDHAADVEDGAITGLMKDPNYSILNMFRAPLEDDESSSDDDTDDDSSDDDSSDDSSDSSSDEDSEQ